MVKKLMTLTLIISIAVWIMCFILLFYEDSNQIASNTNIRKGRDLEPESARIMLQSCPPVESPPPPPTPPPQPVVVKRIDDGYLHASKVVKSAEEQRAEPASEKDVVYESMYKCQPPKFNMTFPNPCWTKENGEWICAASVMLLGFHRTGSTDLSKWFLKDTMNFVSTSDDYFFHPHDNRLLYDDCPYQYLEQKPEVNPALKEINFAGTRQRLYIGCPGCLVIGHTLHTYPGAIIRRSTVQYIHDFLTATSRYIVTLRDPTERAISHYFHSFQVKDPYEFPEFKNLTKADEVGYDVFHKLVEEELVMIEQCYRELGVKNCVLDITSGAFRKKFAMNLIIQRGCYVVFIREALKFLPKEQVFFSLMETYANHTEEVVNDVMKFIGVPPPAKEVIDQNILQRENEGLKEKPVHQKTRDLLDKFYAPFSKELADLLGDEKYLFK